MKIRPALIKDSPALAQIQVDSYQTTYADILPQEYLAHFSYAEQEEDWQDLLSQPQNDILYIAESHNGELVGYALSRAKGKHYQSELIALHVRPAYQNRGIGQKLLAQSAQALHEQGCASIEIWTLAQNPVSQWYERLDGQLIAQKPWSNNDYFGINIIEIAYGWSDITRLFKIKPNKNLESQN